MRAVLVPSPSAGSVPRRRWPLATLAASVTPLPVADMPQPPYHPIAFWVFDHGAFGPQLPVLVGFWRQFALKLWYHRKFWGSEPSGIFQVAQFSRSKIHLNVDSVGLILQSYFGGNAICFKVSFLRSRCFKFRVSSKDVGFSIYNGGNISNTTFNLHFYLWVNGGPSLQKEYATRSGLVVGQGWTSNLGRCELRCRGWTCKSTCKYCVEDKHALGFEASCVSRVNMQLGWTSCVMSMDIQMGWENLDVEGGHAAAIGQVAC